MKELIYEDYKDFGTDWIGKIPKNWNFVKIKYLCDLINEKTNDTTLYEFRIALENIESFTGFLNGNSDPFNNGNIFRKRDILFNKLRPYLTKVVIAPKNGVAVTEILILRPHKEIFNKFLFYRLLSPDFIDIVDSSTYGAKMPRANWSFIGNLKIPFPRFPDQKRISTFLDKKTTELNDLIADKGRMVELLQEYHQSIISETVTKGLKPKIEMKDSGIEWIGKIPKNWIICKLKHTIKEFDTGGTPSTKKSLNYTEESNGIPWVKISDMTRQDIIFNTQKKITELGLKEKGLKIAKKGTLLYSIFASLGKVSELGINATFNQAIVAIYPNEKKIRKNYLKFWLQFCEIYIQYLSSTNTQENLNLTKVKNLTLVFPKIEEQDIIIEFLNDQSNKINYLIENIIAQIEKLKELRLSLISEAVSGKITPNILDIKIK